MVLNVLLMGFENFQGKENPTKVVVGEYKNKRLEGIEVIPKILPVSFRTAQKRTSEIIKDYNPNLILSLGLGQPEEPYLRLEKYGSNKASGIDGDGLEPPSKKIDPLGQSLIEVNLPIEDIIKLIKEEKIPAYVSEYAGDFVCNFLIYTTMSNLESDKTFGFYHIPFLGKNTLELEQICKGIDITLKSQRYKSEQ